MDLQTFRLLLGPQGQEALDAAMELEPREVDFLGDFTMLNRRFPPGLARAALETAILRREAVQKFPYASRMYFTRPALEQATPHEVSAYRADRYRPFKRLADLGCSVGGDTLSLAQVAPTVGVEIDPLRLQMACANLSAVLPTAGADFVQADLTRRLPLDASPDMALFFDPARRAEGKRIFSVQDYLPPLGTARSWLERFPALGVKISPGVKLDELRSYDAEVEFISLRGELKEAVLWFGPLKTARRRATVLPGPHTLSSPAAALEKLPLSEPQAYLYEPDASILRAGLVAPLGERLSAAQLDPQIAYLTAPDLLDTPFARVWPVEAWFPFGLKRLRAYLRERGIGQVVVKKRGSPLQPEDLIRALRLKGENERTVFLTQLRGRPIVIVCLPSPFLL